MQNPSIIEPRLSKVRTLMNNYSLDALIVASRDEFLNEYADKNLSPRTYISGFDGTAGDILITLNEAYLFVDGRYHTQADNQVDKRFFKIEKVGIDENGQRINELIIDRMIKTITQLFKDMPLSIGYDSNQFSVKTINYLKEQIQKVLPTAVFISLTKNLIDEIRTDKVCIPVKPVYSVPVEITGRSSDEKLKLIRESLINQNLNAIFVTKLDELAYITNFRGNDIDFNSTFKGYAFISNKDAFIFSDMERFNSQDLAILSNIFKVLPVNILEESLSNYVTKQSGQFNIGYEPGSTTGAMLDKLNKLTTDQCKLVPIEDNPIRNLKTIKTPAEINHMQQCFIKADNVFREAINWVNQSLDTHKVISELDIKNFMVETFEKYGGDKLSFDVISAVGSNSAIIHYTHSSSEKIVHKNDLVLIDSGSYFSGGYATDLTRTFLAGSKDVNPSTQMKHIFTLVLKAAIKGLTAEIPPDADGVYLDNIIRSVITAQGYDYNHGTGHGIGILVHESPPFIVYGPAGTAKLKENMVFSIEPGIYIEDWGGVRFENIVTLKKHSDADKAQEGWLEVYCMTYAPIDENLIDYTMLEEEEINYLDVFKKRLETL